MNQKVADMLTEDFSSIENREKTWIYLDMRIHISTDAQQQAVEIWKEKRL
jgi:hypothetical protein